jgi:hypothetical protein
MPAASTSWTCTKTSEPPPSGAIKPYPRSVLKNLTRPLGICSLNPIQRTASAPTRRLVRRAGGWAPLVLGSGPERVMPERVIPQGGLLPPHGRAGPHMNGWGLLNPRAPRLAFSPVARRGFFFVEPIPAPGIVPLRKTPKTLIPQTDPRTLGPAFGGAFSFLGTISRVSELLWCGRRESLPRVGLWTLKAPPIPRRGFLEQLRPNAGSQGSRAITDVRYDTV